MFKAEIKCLLGNNYPDLHHSQQGVKFATQISPLLNFKNKLPWHILNTQKDSGDPNTNNVWYSNDRNPGRVEEWFGFLISSEYQTILLSIQIIFTAS